MTALQLTVILTTLTLLSACGDTTSDRVLSGAGIGAGVGAVGSAVVGGGLLPGALIGGVVGGAAGGLTDSHQMNLGKPLWE
jgi:hypothetical protein